MKIGTNFGPFIKRNNLKTILKKTADVGFEAVDFSLRDYGVTTDEEQGFFTDILSYTNSLGLTISQGHAPFIRKNLSIEYFLGDEWFDVQCTAVRRASYLKIPWVTVHPYTHSPIEGVINEYSEQKSIEGLQVNTEFFKRLLPVYQEYGVGCAVENLAESCLETKRHYHCFGSCSKELKALLNNVNNHSFGVCLDVGHLNLLKGETHKECILNLGENLKTLHLSDNFGELNCSSRGTDKHLPPFYGSVPWDEIVSALKQIGFDGAFSFECINYMPDDEFDLLLAKYIYRGSLKILGRNK